MRITLPHTSIIVDRTSPTQLIAEIGLNHNGNLDLAKELIRQSVLSGAQLLKLQKRSPSDLATPQALDSLFLKCPGLGSTQRELRDLHEFDLHQFKELISYAAQFNALLFTSVFDVASFEFAQELGITLIKVASHSITNLLLLKRIAASGSQVIISNGGTSISETKKALSYLDPANTILMHCVSSYPTSADNAFLGTIPHLLTEFPHLPIGYSSHEVGTDLSIAAAALGACLIERHITLSRSLQGFDHKISLLPDEFAELSIKLQKLSAARGVKINLLPSESTSRFTYHVGIYAKRPLQEGYTLTEDDLELLQPANNPDDHFTGLDLELLLGRRLLVPLAQGQQLTRSHIQ